LTEAERQEFLIKTQLQTASSLEITQGTCINFCRCKHRLLKLNTNLPVVVMKRWHFHFIDLGGDAAQAVSEGDGHGGTAARVHLHGSVLGPPCGTVPRSWVRTNLLEAYTCS